MSFIFESCQWSDDKDAVSDFSRFLTDSDDNKDEVWDFRDFLLIDVKVASK
jgi:hypothetical protein